MLPLALLLFGLTAAWVRAEGPPPLSLSSATASRVAALEETVSQSLTARRLLAQTGHVPRRHAPHVCQGEVFRYDGKQNLLAVDSRRLDRLDPWQAELALVRELARADMGLPIELKEAEMAAEQAVLEFALERAAGDEAFRRHLAAAAGAAGKRPGMPDGELGRVAYFLVLFRKDPGLFHKAVEDGLPWSGQAVGLAELEDFLEKCEAAPPEPGEAPYVRLAGRRYRAAVARAAGLVRPLGGRAFLREVLGLFDGAEAASLLLKIKAFFRYTKDQ